MAKIPQYLAERVDTGQPISPGDIAAPFNAAAFAARSQEQVGASIIRLGESFEPATRALQDYIKAQNENARALDYIDRNARITEGLGRLGLEFEQDPDWQTKTKRFREAAEKFISGELDQVNDPVIKQMITRDANKLLVHHDLSLMKSSNRQRLDDLKGRGLQALEIYEREEDQAPDNQAAAMIRAKRQAAIVGMVRAGVIKAEDGIKMDQRIDENLAETDARRAIRNNPQGAYDKLLQGGWDQLTPQRREALVGMAQRQIDIDLKERDRIAERMDRKAERLANQLERDEEATVTAGIIKGTMGYRELEDLRRQGRISSRGYLQGVTRLEQGVEKQTRQFETFLDHWFRTKGPLEGLDSENEKYRADLKMELKNKITGGTAPETAFQEILTRELQKPRDVGYFPAPIFFDGDPGKPEDYSRAAERTLAALQAGQIDERTAYYQGLLIDGKRNALLRKIKRDSEAEGNKSTPRSRKPSFLETSP